MSKSPSNNISRNVGRVGALTGLSRVLGLVRVMLTSRLIGAGMMQSAFVVAFQIPNLFRKLLGEGALTAAFVPVFKEQLVRGDEEGARRLARAVASMVFLLLGAVCVAGIAGISVVLPFINPDGETAATLRLTRVMLPYAAMICTAAFAAGVLNGVGKFWHAAFAPALLNLIWIPTLVSFWFFPQLTVQRRIEIVSWSVLLSGVSQMLFLLRASARNGVTLSLTFQAWRDAGVATVWRNTFIGAISAGAIQINLVVDNLLAFKAAEYGPCAIEYAERLVYLPLGVVATAFVTVLLPTLSGRFAKDALGEARALLGKSVEEMLALMLPAAAGLFVMSHEIVELVYEGREFTQADTIFVSRALQCYALGLVAFSLHKMLSVWFHAQKDMKTPLKVGVMMIALNVTLNVAGIIFLPDGWKHAGIAASTVVCSFISSGILALIALRRRIAPDFRAIGATALRLLAATAIMTAATFFARNYFYELVAYNQVPKLFGVLVPIAAALATYALTLPLICPKITRRMFGKTSAKRSR